ncbi:MAG: hypothetical protein AB7R89_04625 [Dehalococcoidia bacterium]
MIKNERQYKVAKQEAARLEAGLTQLLERETERHITDPLLEEAALAGVRHVLGTLHDEIVDYESRTRSTPDGSNPDPAKSPTR